MRLWRACQFDPQQKPEPGTVEIDPDHALARGLIGLWMFSEGAGGVVTNLCSGTAPLTLATTPLWTSGIGGSALDFTYTNSQYLQAPATWAAGIATQASIVFRLRRKTALPGIDTQSGLAYLGGSGLNNHYPFTDGNIYCSLLHSSRPSLGTPKVVMTNWHQYAVTTNPTAWTVYQNATVLGSAAGDATVSVAGSTIGKSFGAFYFDGQMDSVLLSSACYSPGEIAWLAAEPYAMLRPVRSRTYSIRRGRLLALRRRAVLGL